MIDEKTIENIVDSNVSLVCELIPDSPIVDYQESLKNLMICCIKIGIELALKDLWHPASEEPERGKQIITQWLSEGEYCYEIDCLLPRVSWTQHICDNNIAKWCYLADLLPENNKNKQNR